MISIAFIKRVFIFACGGFGAMAIDIAMARWLLELTQMPLLSRMVAFGFAVICTWLFHRSLTWQVTKVASFAEFGHFVSVSAIGMVVNLTVSLTIAYWLGGASGLTWGIFCGSISGAALNFIGYTYVFKSAKTGS
ncbi:MAG: GtrA family protein [Cohaesibacteraceae bacterium]|nr:GtrA family protein [Cohaesibacteraceae bacterium]